MNRRLHVFSSLPVVLLACSLMDGLIEEALATRLDPAKANLTTAELNEVGGWVRRWGQQSSSSSSSGGGSGSGGARGEQDWRIFDEEPVCVFPFFVSADLTVNPMPPQIVSQAVAESSSVLSYTLVVPAVDPRSGLFVAYRLIANGTFSAARAPGKRVRCEAGAGRAPTVHVMLSSVGLGTIPPQIACPSPEPSSLCCRSPGVHRREAHRRHGVRGRRRGAVLAGQRECRHRRL